MVGWNTGGLKCLSMDVNWGIFNSEGKNPITKMNSRWYVHLHFKRWSVKAVLAGFKNSKLFPTNNYGQVYNLISLWDDQPWLWKDSDTSFLIAGRLWISSFVIKVTFKSS